MGIIAFTLLLKKGLAVAESAVRRQMQGVVEQIYEEFTVLGFLGMVSYFLIQLNIFQQFSKAIYGEEMHLVHVSSRRSTLASASCCSRSWRARCG